MKASPRVARRKVLAALGVAAAGVSAGVSALRSSSGTSSSRPLADLVGPIGEWRVEQVMPLVAGAVPVLMRTPDGKRLQIDLMRADAEGPRAVAQVGGLALYVANGGAGDRPSKAVEAQGAQLLAGLLSRREAERGASPIAGLLTLSERLAAHREAVLTPWA